MNRAPESGATTIQCHSQRPKIQTSHGHDGNDGSPMETYIHVVILPISEPDSQKACRPRNVMELRESCANPALRLIDFRFSHKLSDLRYKRWVEALHLEPTTTMRTNSRNITEKNNATIRTTVGHNLIGT